MRRAGLRARLVLALLATSVVTLVAAIATLVPPLNHRLERDRLNELRVLARTTRFGIRELPDADVQPGSAGARMLVIGLQRRTGGRVALLAADGTSLADTDPDRDGPVGLELQRVRALHLKRVSDVREGVRHGEAIVVTGVRRPDGGRLVLVIRKPLNDTRAAADEVRAALAPAVAVGTAVALLLALAFSRGLMRRLRLLRDDARALETEGLGHAVQVGPRDEVGEVADALESMRARLVAEDAARLAFLGTASHELRTPLATLQATLELMQEDLRAAADGSVDVGALRARAQGALDQTHRLTGLAVDLLDLNRVDAEAPLSADPLELVEAASMVQPAVADALASRDRRLVVDGSPPVYALGDPSAVLRIMMVLLDNARAYGEGTVTLLCVRRGDQALVRVTDEGQGLSDRDRDRVFDRFERGDAGVAVPGFGLGLPIARGLAERMGGTLEVVAADGACFELRLPAWDPEAG